MPKHITDGEAPFYVKQSSFVVPSIVTQRLTIRSSVSCTLEPASSTHIAHVTTEELHLQHIDQPGVLTRSVVDLIELQSASGSALQSCRWGGAYQRCLKRTCDNVLDEVAMPENVMIV